MMLLKMKLIFAVVTLACLDSFVLPDFQGDALFALRASLVSSDDQLTDWNPNQVNPCTWSNVLCDPNDNVISLTWSDIGFSGTLSPKVGALTALQTLTLQGNGITGGIPEELGKLTNLTSLNLEHNDLTGEIPSTLGNLTKLQYLSLGINNLNGTIPHSLSNLSSLINLQLSYNALSGQIPSRLFHVPEYDFRGNRLNCDGNSHYHCASAIADSGLKSSSNKPKLGIIVGAVGGLIILLSTGGVLYFMCKRRHNGYKREVLVDVAGISQVDGDGWSPNLSLNILVQIGKTTTDRSIGVYGENRRKILELLNFMKSDRPTAHVNGIQSDGKMGHDLSVFSYATLMAATCNFSQENKLGQGGFGPVYKGKLTTGREIAVKRLSKCSGQGILEFKNELTLISELQHTNLVQLFGFCIHGEEMMLIYEYMPNKSLDYHLFDSIKGLQLNWEKRFTIIEGIAQGLLYLHKYSRLQVIHRDLKSSNVLLDENMNPKISDFGMARIFTYNELEANTNRIVGTRGYMSPEYAMEGIFSIKSDVYSFGVLMLEIISGRRSNSFYNDDRVLNIVGYTWELWKEGAGLKLMDPTLGDDSCINRDQVLRCIHVGLLCVEENGADRPTMFDVISMLTNQTMSLPTPTKPAFCVERKVVVTGISIGGNGPGITSINGMSNSDFNAR